MAEVVVQRLREGEPVGGGALLELGQALDLPQLSLAVCPPPEDDVLAHGETDQPGHTSAHERRGQLLRDVEPVSVEPRGPGHAHDDQHCQSSQARARTPGPEPDCDRGDAGEQGHEEARLRRGGQHPETDRRQRVDAPARRRTIN